VQVHLVAAGQDGHGKTSLVAALGLPEDDRVGVIDPGAHGRLVPAMLEAGPSGIDGYVIVVAADEGITAQTREHAALLRALGVEHGVSVVTKVDLADPTEAVRAIEEMIPGTRAQAASARTGDGLRGVGDAVAAVLARLPTRADPAAGVFGGGRPPGVTRVIDAALDFGPRREREPEHGVKVVVHLAGRESPARLARLGGRFWQVRLDEPLAAAAGDRFVIRQTNPPDTLGGGIVLDPAARRHPTSNELIVRLTRISRGQAPLPPERPRGP
jgi:selenocysteine-specific translation elongation factor